MYNDETLATAHFVGQVAKSRDGQEHLSIVKPADEIFVTFIITVDPNLTNGSIFYIGEPLTVYGGIKILFCNVFCNLHCNLRNNELEYIIISFIFNNL